MDAATDLPRVAELYSQSNPEPISPEEILEWDGSLVEGAIVLTVKRQLERTRPILDAPAH
jgi:hypothetical protein